MRKPFDIFDFFLTNDVWGKRCAPNYVFESLAHIFPGVGILGLGVSFQKLRARFYHDALVHVSRNCIYITRIIPFAETVM